jgi:UDP-glucose 4-epimerase
MNILVTGGAGFIGSHICEYLNYRDDIKKIVIIDNLEDGSKKNLSTIINSKKIKLFKCDIRNLNSIVPKFKNIDCVVHLAALSDIVPSITDPVNYLNTNVNGTMNVLESMRKNKVDKIVYAASSSCYGIPDKYPTSETQKINPKYPYAYSKYIGEKTIKHWSNVYGINYISLRLFNVYGTRSRTHGAYGAALGVFLKQKLSNSPLTIVGNGNQKRDFVYVSDVAEAFYLSIKTKIKNKVFNVGSGKPKSVNELAKYIGGKKVFIPKRPGEPNITHADIKNISKFLKWKSKISLKEGISRVLKEISYWKKAPLWTPKKIEKTTRIWFKYLK